MIPFVDLPDHLASLLPAYRVAFDRICRTGHFILGTDVGTFERAFAAYTGSRYAVGVSNGTDALVVALRALEIGPGDEVVLPAFTFISTAFAVLMAGATPVFCDVEDETLSIDADSFRRVITKKTKAVIPVHMFGMPADMEAVAAAAGPVQIIEDAAQAHGSYIGKAHAGSLGVIGCFSFYPSKNLGALGDAGAVITDSKRLYERMKTLSNIGASEKYRHTFLGGNTRLDTLQAAFLRISLPRLRKWNAARARNADLYLTGLAGLPLKLPRPVAGRTENNHLFVVRTPKRDALRKFLNRRGIETGIHYPLPLHLQPALRGLGYGTGTFPVSESAAKTVLSLPMYPELTGRQVRDVVTAIRDFFS